MFHNPDPDSYLQGKLSSRPSSEMRVGSMAWRGKTDAEAAAQAAAETPGASAGGLSGVILLLPPLFPVIAPIIAVWSEANASIILKLFLTAAILIGTILVLYLFYKLLHPVISYALSVWYIETSYLIALLSYSSFSVTTVFFIITIFGYFGGALAWVGVKRLSKKGDWGNRRLRKVYYLATPLVIAIIGSYGLSKQEKAGLLPEGPMRDRQISESMLHLGFGDKLITSCDVTRVEVHDTSIGMGNLVVPKWLNRGTVVELASIPSPGDRANLNPMVKLANGQLANAPAECLKFYRKYGADENIDWSQLVLGQKVMSICETPLFDGRSIYRDVNLTKIDPKNRMVAITDPNDQNFKNAEGDAGCFRPAKRWETWPFNTKLKIICKTLSITTSSIVGGQRFGHVVSRNSTIENHGQIYLDNYLWAYNDVPGKNNYKLRIADVDGPLRADVNNPECLAPAG